MLSVQKRRCHDAEARMRAVEAASKRCGAPCFLEAKRTKVLLTSLSSSAPSFAANWPIRRAAPSIVWRAQGARAAPCLLAPPCFAVNPKWVCAGFSLGGGAAARSYTKPENGVVLKSRAW